MMIKTVCPQCGAPMEVDDSRETVFCEYCGTKIQNLAQRVEVSGTVKHVVDRSADPNLIISYSSSHPGVMMVTRIVDTGRKDTFMSGQRMTFRLAQGGHTVVLKIGKKNYNRQIYIPKDNSPVRINASYSGVAHISIDQPTVSGEEMESARTALATKKASGLSILAFILSFTVFLSIIGVGLGIFDLIKGNKEKKHGLSIAAIVIGVVFSMYLIASLVS